MMKKTFTFLAALVFMCGLSTSSHAVPILSNGSLTGPIDNWGVPPGWVILAESPDTMDENNNVGGSFGGFGATPSPSPDGGTWVGIADDPSTNFFEIFGQDVSGFDVGTTYNVSWYQANFGYTPLGYVNPDSIGLFVDSVFVGAGSVAPLAPGWTLETLQLTASATTHALSFGLGGTAGRSYMSIDGISIAEVAPVPEPATILLLGTGLVGFAGARLRKKFKR
jgi:hypothetical protein